MGGAAINITGMITEIIADIARRYPLFSHVDTSRLLVCTGSNRRNSRGGIYGKVVPLRFKNGSRIMKHRGRHYGIPEITHEGNTCLYLIYFYMPKFFDLEYKKKINVIIHELYHISPDFNGDIRRITKGKAAHGHSKEAFDRNFGAECDDFARAIAGTEMGDFLSMTSRDIFKRYSSVYSRRMVHPKPVPVPAAKR